MFLRLLVGALVAFISCTSYVYAEEITVTEKTVSTLYGTWKGWRRYSRPGGAGGENIVTIKISEGSPLTVRFETDNQGSWNSKARFTDNKLQMRAWRAWRTFKLFRTTKGHLLLESQWNYEHPQFGATEAILQVTKEN